MAGAQDQEQQYRFGPFYLDAHSGELHKHGCKLKLRGHPIQILIHLVERPGELVTREQLRERLWPADTFVDFDHGLNSAIKRLRQTLLDDVDHPRYIETVPRRGYRFISTVESGSGLDHSEPVVAPPRANSAVPAVPVPALELVPARAGDESGARVHVGGHYPRRRLVRLLGLSAFAATVLLTVAGIFVWRKIQYQGGTGRFLQRQLTANPSEIPLQTAAISPDGKYLAYSDAFGLHLQLIRDGQAHIISLPEQLAISNLSWLPDGTAILASGEVGGNVSSTWLIPTLGTPPVKLREQAGAPVASPDGSLIAFLGDFDGGEKHGIWLMDRNGENVHRVLTAQAREQFFRVRWSPDGQRLAFTKSIAGVPAVAVSQSALGTEALESVSLNAGKVTSILTRLGLQDFYWLSDGRILFSVAQEDLFGSDSNLWAIHTDRNGKPVSQPEQLTNWVSFSFTDFSATKDGRSLAFLKLTSQMDVSVGELDASRTHLNAPRRLTLNDRNDWPIEWTRDGAILFWSDRNGSWDIFRQRLDQQSAEMIPMGSDPKWYAHFSPDGAWLLYMALPKQQQPGGELPVRIMRVSSGGGPPEEVLSAVGTTNFSCARWPATLCVLNEVIGNEVLITLFDPLKGKGREVLRAKAGGIAEFSLSPDGSRLATLPFDPQGGRIRLISLNDGTSRDLFVSGRNRFLELNWSPDSRGLYVSGQTSEGSTVLYINLQGHAHALWQESGNFATCGRPSPDGHSLAVASRTANANAWTLEHF